MRFRLANDDRQGYIVMIPPVKMNTEMHIITMADAAGVGLKFGDKVELDMEGGPYVDDRRVEGVVVGTVTHLPDPEPVEF
jgi:hypothetical protein